MAAPLHTEDRRVEDSVTRCMNDKSVKVRSAAVSCMGYFGEDIGPKQVAKILGLLDDSFLQVRTVVCEALRTMV